jgi:hypothetical protein
VFPCRPSDPEAPADGPARFPLFGYKLLPQDTERENIVWHNAGTGVQQWSAIELLVGAAETGALAIVSAAGRFWTRQIHVRGLLGGLRDVGQARSFDGRTYQTSPRYDPFQGARSCRSEESSAEAGTTFRHEVKPGIIVSNSATCYHPTRAVQPERGDDNTWWELGVPERLDAVVRNVEKARSASISNPFMHLIQRA